MTFPRSVLLIITGSIASYKALELIRLLRAKNVTVTAIVTKSGAQFVTPLSVSALTGTKTYTDLFSLTDEIEMGHIELSRIADLVLVAPASADILAKMAAGIADDLATTALLATNKPVIVAPAMNHKMWSHAATQRNVAQLKIDGITFIDPTEGDMACGEHGVGRFAEPAAIAKFIGAQANHSAATTRSLFAQGKSELAGKHAIVTSGPTSEAIDPVRFLGNHSSGKQGHAIAAALAAAGARVTLVSGNVALPDPEGVETMHVTDADTMLAAVQRSLPADIFIAAAAVADWKLAVPSAQKLKKKSADATLTLKLIPTVDVLATIARGKKRPTLVIGFAAETNALLANARQKRQQKNCDWILANDASGGTVFGADQNRITLITATKEQAWERMDKTTVARQLVAQIINHFASPVSQGKSA